MKLVIKYGKRYDTNRIAFYLNEQDWYKSHKIRIILPEKLKTNEEIKDYIDKNFNEEEYKNIGDKILTSYNKISKIFSQKIKSKLNKNLPKELNVLLTKYGSGGSYIMPNSIVINIDYNIPFMYTLKHEFLHLLFDEEIVKKNLSHEEKESFIKKMESSLL